MKGFRYIITLTFLGIILFIYPQSASATVSQESVKVDFSGGSRTVNAVYVDLNDESIRMEAAISQNQLGTADTLQNIAEQLRDAETEVIAAINGTFFSAYDGNPLPWGSIQRKGEFIHLGNTGTCIGFTLDKQVLMDNLYVAIEGSTNSSWKWPDNWYAWALNHTYESPEAIVIYTPAYGTTTGCVNKPIIVVRNKEIIDITEGEASIPADGYCIAMGDRSILSRFKVGKKIDYRFKYSDINFNNSPPLAGNPIQWENVYSTIGAGPRLLKDGLIIADGAAEGFSEAKINTDRGQRSFVGLSQDKRLIMGTVANVSIKELAEIAQQMGLYNAINLDGGASSGLYYQGRYLTTPGRLLSNALVVTKKSIAASSGQQADSPEAVTVFLNGKQIIFDVPPLIEEGRTLVPLRAIFEAMGAKVGWDGESKTATAQRANTKVYISIGSREPVVDGQVYPIDVPARIYVNRTLAPLRFVGEAFGGQVEWDASSRTVYIELADN